MEQPPTPWLPKTTANVDTTGLQSQQQIIGLSNGNTIITPYNADTSSGAVAGDILGVFLGCEYSTGAGPIFGKLRQQYYPASTNAPNAVATCWTTPTRCSRRR